MPRIILDAIHVDTCLPCFWSGHHLPHVQIPVWRNMTLAAIKEGLHAELSMGAVAGCDDRIRDDSGPEGARWYAAAHAAVNRIKPNHKGQRTFFTDLEESDDLDDHGDTVYAFFVFEEMD